MQLTTTLLALIGATASLTAASAILSERATIPAPCEIQTDPLSDDEAQKRFKEFTQAFVVKKDVSKGFEFIAANYVNHNPKAATRDAAWANMSPIWDNMATQPLRSKWIAPYAYLQWQADVGLITDRFLWDGGCIVEHWYQGESWPA
ncbi:uncharacterized protein RCC_02456 [Ramularia collo-cygni]|uniref:SnoaL-like domain-containing protein n=1 Tax=Ramularia collo-cygni TaxID=112498 RepID=A0A2D3UMK5_9PEZI|nr:uncharacterized protein RCC_02456 [Ramularia collo-cygni]CZT16622.1 uncharacterized protein RCC_02456 [Ramularia collo-cygni]